MQHRYQEIVTRIETLIEKGEFAPGDKIPAERKLAQTFSVSRNCVREAIRALSEKGMLESRLGDGTYVRVEKAQELKTSLAEALEAQTEKLQEIFELRILLEPQIARLAAERITAPELDRLKAIVLDQGRAVESGKDDAALDTLFHQVLAEAASNSVILTTMNTIKALLEDTRSEFMRPLSRKNSSVKGHLSIIEALEQKDPQAAYAAMSDHIQTMQQQAFASLDKE